MAQRGRRDITKEQFWRRMLRLWDKSGLTIRDFCVEHDLPPSSFYFWRRTICQRDQEAAHTSSSNSNKTKCEQARNDKPGSGTLPLFVPVTMPAATNHASTTTDDRPIEVVLGSGVLVRIPVGFDDGTLRQLLNVLEEHIGEEPTC